MKGREFKDAVFEQFSRIAGAFASPNRIEIIDVLAQGERSVDALAAETGLSRANASRHLQILKSANLVSHRREGVQVFYRLADPAVLMGYRALRQVAEARLGELDRLVRDYFSGAGGLETLPRAELVRRVKSGDAIVIDVRPVQEYAAGHVADARSIPLADLERRLSEIPANRTIVAYCRGPYCVLAVEAVRLLRDRGLQAVRLEDGFPEWRDAGLPVSSDTSVTKARITR